MQAKELDEIKIFFILGRPRSGTTLLRTLFDAHSNVSIPYEGRLIINLYNKYGKIKRWNKEKLLQFYNDLLLDEKINTWEFKESLKEDIINLGTDANYGRLIKLVYLNFNSLFNKEKLILIGDKNPFYSYRKPYFKIIKEIFPSAKFIHLVRDYRAHYLSMSKINFENNKLSIVADFWKYSYKIINDEFSKSENYYYLKHEDLISNPVDVLKKLCKFLEIDLKTGMLDYYKIKDLVLSKYGDEILKIHSSLLNPITDKYNNKWKTELNEETIRNLDTVVGNYAENAGYERLFNSRLGLGKKLYVSLYRNLYLFYANIIDYLPLKYKRVIQKQPGLFFKLFN